MKKTASLSKATAYYLECRSKLGFALRTDRYALQSLVRYAQKAHHKGSLTAQLALNWARLPERANPLWWARRLDMARRFARFWVQFDPRTEVPPVGVFGPSYRRRPAHIYSPAEVAKLMAATKLLGQPWLGATFKTLLGLLAASGLRISEALRLELRDIDWTRGLLLIRESKFGHSRQIPQLSRKRRSAKAGAAFFQTAQGQALSYGQAESVFRKLRRHLGWTQSPPPRLHDLRHTFAVNCLLRWYQQHQPIGHKILALTTYLGHRRVTDTYWYLSAVPQLLCLAQQRWEKHSLRPRGGRANE